VIVPKIVFRVALEKISFGPFLIRIYDRHMQADFSIELGADDPTLIVPWEDPSGASRYYDLKLQPDLLLYIPEALRYPELGEFLSAVNSSRSILQTAKCDLWFTTELNEEEQIYEAAGKFGGYIDLFFTTEERRTSFAYHESFARQLTALLSRAPEMPSSMEVIIRQAHFEPAERDSKQFAAPDPRPGFYFTCYVFGYGDQGYGDAGHDEAGYREVEDEARLRWAVALKLVENAFLQLASCRPGLI
jgi:hypothetical protein